MEVFETLHRIAPDDVVTLNNLVWSLRRSDPQRAPDLVRQALAAAPDTPEIQDPEAMILLEQGDYQKALELNQKILDATGSSQFAYHRARILEASGDHAAAIATLKTLLAGDDFAGRAEAEAMLARLE